jgi:hypothetical protein
MNMVNDVVNTLAATQGTSSAQSTSSSQGLASGLQTAYPSGEERKQQIESQRARSKPQMPIASGLQAAFPIGEERKQQIESQLARSTKPQMPIKTQQRKTGIYTLSDLPKPKGEAVGVTVPVYAKSFGGKYKTRKNNRKNRTTRKHKKNKRNKRSSINNNKTKKQIIKRTRRH